ncbi:glutaredoxin [Polyporus arcularius HHB13444]|uniref:Glutaredoxin n=1 Tax=Polyporus arcularius HHB13444 TaxID=1314778 RepID=A0A5C3PSG0_9APHY|nr:glutaredoxin [Polyporus arcularius HHB13444]
MKRTTTPQWTGSPYRRRRILWALVLLTLGGIYYLSVYGAPSSSFLSLSESLKDWGYRFSPDSSGPGRVAQAKAQSDQTVQEAYAGQGAYADVREIDALLHFLTAHPQRRLDEDGGSIRVEGLGSVVVDVGKPIDLKVYAPDGKYDWEEHTKRVKDQYPLVVFSKTFCPYSRSAKTLLASYEIEPAPKIIELNVRSDGPQLQAILARLTGRSTVPNILLKGSSIGGSDDVHQMHEEHRLKRLLEEGGLTINGAAAETD